MCDDGCDRLDGAVRDERAACCATTHRVVSTTRARTTFVRTNETRSRGVSDPPRQGPGPGPGGGRGGRSRPGCLFTAVAWLRRTATRGTKRRANLACRQLASLTTTCGTSPSRIRHLRRRAAHAPRRAPQEGERSSRACVPPSVRGDLRTTPSQPGVRDGHRHGAALRSSRGPSAARSCPRAPATPWRPRAGRRSSSRADRARETAAP